MEINITNFEEAMKELQTRTEQIRSPKTNLQDALRCYEEGMAYYKACKEWLDAAQQKIETIEVE